MKRYLCPICDQELTARSYCPVCRKMIRNPIIYDGVLPNEDSGNYFLNHREKHPDRACVEVNRDRECESKAEKMLEGRFSTSYSSGQNSAPGSQIWRSESTRNYTYGVNKQKRQGSVKGKVGCITVLIILWVIGIIAGFVGEVLENIDVESWFAGEMTPDIRDESETVVVSEAWDDGDGFIEPDYDQILAIGEHCSGTIHYPVSGAMVYEKLTYTAETELGLTVTEASEYMYNEIDTSDPDKYSYYDRSYYWAWEDGFFCVSSDSVTDEIHYVSARSSYAHRVIELILEAFCAVDDSENEKTMRIALNEAVQSDEIKDGVFIEMGNSSVWIYLDEEYGYFMTDIYPMTE